jgi:ferredoxin
MTYVVTDKCIRCKYTDCVSVCPVDCFYEGRNMLVIDPDVCIDCGVCVPECPVDAIVADTDPAAQPYLELNRSFSRIWPNLTTRKPPPPDAARWDDTPSKYPDQFSAEPGEGE